MRISFLIFLLSISLIGCSRKADSNQTTSNPPENTTETSETEQKEDASQEAEDWLIIPNVRVGKIMANSTAEDIAQAYPNNISNDEVGIGEGIMTQVTHVYAGTPNALTVYWKEGAELQKIDRIVISTEGSSWKTENGITVGTTLEKLEELNGQPFKLYGFEWDYAGTITSWENGQLSTDFKISEKFVAQLGTEKAPSEGYGDIVGEDEFLSNHAVIKTRELKVIQMGVIF